MNLGDDAGMNAGAPELNAAAGESGKGLDIGGLRGAEQADAVVAQVACVVEGSGIAIVARGMEFGADAQARAIEDRVIGRSGDRVICLLVYR